MLLSLVASLTLAVTPIKEVEEPVEAIVVTVEDPQELTKVLETHQEKHWEKLKNDFKKAESLRIAKEKQLQKEKERKEALEKERLEREISLQKQQETEKDLGNSGTQSEDTQKPSQDISSKSSDNQNNNQSSVNTSGWSSGLFTAYYPTTDPAEIAMQGTGVTANGTNIHTTQYRDGRRIIAAPPRFSFGTKIDIEVNGTLYECIVDDRGGAIQGNHFDIVHPDKSSAYAFGKVNGRYRIVN